MLPARISRNLPKPVPRKREGNSEAHLELIRQCHCVRCYRPPRVTPHHLQRGLPVGERGMKRKAADRYTIPLCLPCHRWVEKTGNDEEQLASIGIDGRALAAALWFITGDLDAMDRYVFRFHQASRLYGERR